MNQPTDYSKDLYIDTDDALISLCEQLRDARLLAIDTEFIRDKTYYSKLCLIQIASDDVIACIDPLAINNIDPLLDILYDPNVIKLMHAARQDLEIFYYLRQSLPCPVFDTQIAATVLGYGEQVGYSNLVENILGRKLEKGHARTDWGKRPLDTAQLHYAADDVRYLLQLYPLMDDKLAQLGRRDWLEEDFKLLCQPELYTTAEADLWQRVKGHQRLSGVKLAMLQQLAIWREHLAMKKDRPRRWILSDDILVDIVKRAPHSAKELGSIRGLPERFMEQHQQTILQLITDAEQQPKESWPRLIINRPSPQQDVLSDVMMGLLRLRATEHNISTTILATRKDIEKIAMGQRDLPLLKGWRAKLAGHDLLAFLDGQTRLEVDKAQLVLLEKP